MNIRCFLILFVLFQVYFLTVRAQNAHFASSGTIEYVKTVNLYALLKRTVTKENAMIVQPLIDQFKSDHKQFKKLLSTLTFTTERSFFQPSEIIEDNNLEAGFNFPLTNPDYMIFTDFLKSIAVSEKPVFEKSFVIKDSLKKITWKLVGEKRQIAGYLCRRANGLILDSVYVVAFYAEKIPIPGGPAGFHGLPGMILGVVLPHENVSWFATSVIDKPVTVQNLISSKATVINYDEYLMKLKSFSSNWGNFSNTYLMMFSL